ncbi:MULTISPECIES: AAA domain-containing protein [Brenneria]|uniref:DNA helicase n=1 Tax=Brenneria nigrifluens DSM 30175 = ATCC 13028 TaxID=1121120 RepID=A0A2U1UIT1_9GAMM|nr:MULTISPECIES: AAA domain-containing protein [Brenneria]EHD23390.1 putative superfamily I DNA helicase [Brenneria sp. EniD312]PWC21563.1 DNA helicase [Brenneria nigrifluens] [Brenneria nigrifluens DSM 30175 = ATCC 13028]QCR06319.1 DNA helicase [Brenneria nigrifluens] [Brenneria nigrifluens DSM 30175 = ATCC 13028]
MDADSLRFAAYWRNSLADAESGLGAFERKNVDIFTQWSAVDIDAGQLDEDSVNAFFSDEDQEVKTVEVVLRPKVYFRLLQHGQERIASAPAVVTPLVTSALLSRAGYLYPTPATSIPRDLLEPLPKGTFSLGEVAQFDRYKTTHTSVSIKYNEIPDEESESEAQREARQERYLWQWRHYLEDCDQLLEVVAGEWITNHPQYEAAQYGYVVKKTQPQGAAKHILALYDHLPIGKPDSPLFKRFASQKLYSTEPLLQSGDKFVGRLGYCGEKFPLATAQRDALSHFINIDHGDILAVNGPPGTGKTTLVLSIIATLWARAALEKGEPPVILAMSTNNQAVTNIIEAFGKDFSVGAGCMAGRWLPEIKSFGAYFPSRNRKDEANKKYQTEDFFNHVELKEYLEDAEEYYLDKARAAFPGQEHYSPDIVVELLHRQLTSQSDKLTKIQTAWDTLSRIRQQRIQIAGNIEQYIADKSTILSGLKKELETLKSAEKSWRQYLNDESLIFSFFSWIPAVRTKRWHRIRFFIDNLPCKAFSRKEWTDPEEIGGYISDLIGSAEKECAELGQRLASAAEIVAQETAAVKAWRAIAGQLGYEGEEELDFAQADALADMQIRFPAFLLTTHYWEGRWLMDMANIGNLHEEKRKNGRRTVIPRWYRRMKLTPCVVMTCYMLPRQMQVSEYRGQKGFETDYLYDFADLLIVDEAGQVLPEVAAASFSLAKKALVIGDTEQIAPIWNVTPTIDIGNMLSEGILAGESKEELQRQYALITHSAKSAAAGSVMKVAQCASRYQYDPELARGMYLYEHRRCFDNIIGYCNELCYHGKLLPMRGNKDDNLFPVMGYLHIDGKGETANGGSCYNVLEAETIAAWVMENKEKIENDYHKSIYEVIGVVTPFSAQVASIRQAFEKLGLWNASDENGITIGTVHSLQGAERAIVIFSPVYSKHEDGGFIDSDNSMLNVAISRAKDSFLVFGDMDLFEVQPPSSPRGLLAKYLFSSENNALYFASKERNDLKSSETQIYTLHGAAQHDDFLHQAFKQAGASITIVSPWLSWQKLEQTGFLDAMSQACRRGIEVTVVTDRSFNTEDSDYEKRKQKKLSLNVSLAALQAMGIKTRLVTRVHSKIVIGDAGLLCVGSFNWFSATRDARYERYDTSLVYRGQNLGEEISAIHSSLDKRLI